MYWHSILAMLGAGSLCGLPELSLSKRLSGSRRHFILTLWFDKSSVSETICRKAFQKLHEQEAVPHISHPRQSGPCESTTRCTTAVIGAQNDVYSLYILMPWCKAHCVPIHLPACHASQFVQPPWPVEPNDHLQCNEQSQGLEHFHVLDGQLHGTNEYR